MLRVFTLVPYLWLLVLFLVPFGIVLKIAFSDYAISIPPYTPQLDLAAGWEGLKAFFAALDGENFTFLTEDDQQALFTSIHPDQDSLQFKFLAYLSFGLLLSLTLESMLELQA